MILTLSLCLAMLQDDSLPRRPMLTIETGRQHIGVEGRTDASGKWLVTGGGTDPTLRVWSLSKKMLWRTLRFPLGEGMEGMSNRVAISSDGALVAVGTDRRAKWNNGDAVYVFDVESAKLVHRISGLPHGVGSLAFSPDGRKIAIGLTASGLLEYNLATRGSKKYEFNGPIYSVTYEKSGALFAALMYVEPGFAVIRNGEVKKIKSAAVRAPTVLALSPSGGNLAVGGSGSHSVDVYDAGTLKHVRTLTVPRTRPGFNDIPCWMPDSKMLIMGSSAVNQAGHLVVYAWPTPDSPQPTELALVSPSGPIGEGAGITMLVPLPTGVGALLSNNDIMEVGPNLSTKVIFEGSAASFARATGPAESRKPVMLANKDLTQLSIPLRNNQWLTLDLSRRRFASSKQSRFADQLSAPATQTPDLQFQLSASELLSGKQKWARLVYSWAISTPTKEVAVGTMREVKLFGADAKLKWKQPVPFYTNQIATSSDGKTIASAHGDGVVRWWDSTSGDQLLSCYVFPDGREWVAWTPDGYYDCSLNAEELLGWHLNEGTDEAASLIPMGHFRDRLFRPDIVSAAIKGSRDSGDLTTDPQLQRLRGPSERARRVDDLALPPSVEWTRFESTTSAAGHELRFEFRYTGRSDYFVGGHLVLRRDGVELARTTLALAGTWKGSVQVSEPGLDGYVLTLEHGQSQSQIVPPDTVTKRAGSATSPVTRVSSQPKSLHIIALGVNNSRSFPQLHYAERDAHEFVSVLSKHSPLLLTEPFVRVGVHVSRDAIDKKLAELKRIANPGGQHLVIIFLAGHGVADLSNKTYAFPLSNFDEDLSQTKLTDGYLTDLMKELSGFIRVLVVDTCASAEASSALQKALLDSKAGQTTVFAACQPNEAARESSILQHGFFTHTLLEGLRGKATESESPSVTFYSLQAYVLYRFSKDPSLAGQRPQISLASDSVILTRVGLH